MSAASTPRFLGGYGPAAVIGAALVLVALFVPSTSRTELSSAAPSTRGRTSLGVPDDPGSATGGDETATGDASTVAGGAPTIGSTQPGATTAPRAGGSRATAPGVTAARNAPVGSAGARAPAPGQTALCGAQQVTGDAYSPPCFTWGGGDNGGATARGVSKDTITVTIREGTFDKGVIDAISQAALKQGASNFLSGETPELIKSTITGLVDYFNARYQFYGRKIKIQFVSPKGDIITEVLGGGQEGAEADAITAADGVHAFADLSGVSPPYADALARRGVIAIGAPYMSKQWMQDRRPYEWSWFTDCNTVTQTMASYYNARLGGRPAMFAGPTLNGRPRKLAVIAPDSSWFADCVNSTLAPIRAVTPAEATLDPLTYKLDLNAMAPQAYSLIPQLVSNQITSVMCFCDPLMLLFLTSKAREQGYQPEWVETGVAFSDQDAVGQLFDQTNWNGSFGLSFAGNTLSTSGGPGWRAFKSVHPDAVASKTVEALFYQIQLLAIGIQLAGPNLTPVTFEQGMFSYPPRSGPAGTWTFGPGDYTAAGDAREVYYSSRTASAQAGGNGAWIDPTNGAKRYTAGQFPHANPTNG